MTQGQVSCSLVEKASFLPSPDPDPRQDSWKPQAQYRGQTDRQTWSGWDPGKEMLKIPSYGENPQLHRRVRGPAASPLCPHPLWVLPFPTIPPSWGH